MSLLLSMNIQIVGIIASLLSREIAYNILMEATLSDFDPLCQGWK